MISDVLITQASLMENQQTKFENWGDYRATSLRHELSQVNQFAIVLQRGRRM